MPITTPLIPSNQQIDWSLCGIPGGIPSASWPTFTTIQATTYGNGTTDATAGIQAALNSAGAATPNQVVLLGPGTFLINTSLTIPSNVVLRGAGPSSLGGTNVSASYTLLNVKGNTTSAINFGSNPDPVISGSTAITGGLTQGSTSITVASTSGITPGKLMLISQLNDTFVTIVGNESPPNSTWSDGSIGWNGTRVMGQTVLVQNVVGSTITITPLYYAYSSSLSPLATPYSVGCINAGLEDLTIYANNTGYGMNQTFHSCVHCWLLNVENNYTDGDFIDIHWSYRCEVRHCNFHDAYLHTPGTYDSCIDIINKSSGNLIIDNIVFRGHVGIMLEWGAAGNVVAYNFVAGMFDANSPGAPLGGINTHGPHPFFNLIEGNIAPKLYWDNIWGSSSHNVCLRNWFTGTSQYQNPLTGRGTGTFGDTLSGTPVWTYQADFAVDVSQTNTTHSFIGNCVGSQQLISGVTYYANLTQLLPCTSLIVAPTTRSYDANTYCYTFGYQPVSDDGTRSGDNSTPYDTAVIAGDYNYAGSGGTIWHNATAGTILPSLFLSSAPSWFGTLTWPPIDPGSPPSTPSINPASPTIANASSAIIPAGYRFINGQDPPANSGGTAHIVATAASLSLITIATLSARTIKRATRFTLR